MIMMMMRWRVVVVVVLLLSLRPLLYSFFLLQSLSPPTT